MDRITFRDGSGNAGVKKNPECDNIELLHKVIDRLAEYEDTNLSPVEITERLGSVKTTEHLQLEDRFNRFWAVYPIKKAKLDAWRRFAKINPDEALCERMISAVKEQLKTDAWKAGYIPHPATWLHRGEWENDNSVFGKPNKGSFNASELNDLFLKG